MPLKAGTTHSTSRQLDLVKKEKGGGERGREGKKGWRERGEGGGGRKRRVRGREGRREGEREEKREGETIEGSAVVYEMGGLVEEGETLRIWREEI